MYVIESEIEILCTEILVFSFLYGRLMLGLENSGTGGGREVIYDNNLHESFTSCERTLFTLGRKWKVEGKIRSFLIIS